LECLLYDLVVCIAKVKELVAELCIEVSATVTYDIPRRPAIKAKTNVHKMKAYSRLPHSRYK